MQKVISLTNKNIVLATPLILYSLISSVYLVITAGGGKIINLIFALILFILMTSAFLSGWFNMIKLTIIEPDREDPNSLMKDFIPGVGEYFLSTIGLVLITLLIMAFLSIISFFVGANLIGDPGVSADSLAKALQTPATLRSFVAGLDSEQLIKINNWNLLVVGTMTFGYFLLLLYSPALFFNDKNPLKAYFISLKNLFSRKIFKTTGVFLLIFVLNFLMSLLSALFSGNTVMHFILTLLNFYFITAVGVGVFYYYYNNFVDTRLGQNVDIEV